jgi:hypothetical protein
LPSGFSSALIALASVRRRPRGDPQVAVQAGLGGDDAAQLGPLGLGELAGVLDHLVELGEHPGADGGGALAGLGL